MSRADKEAVIICLDVGEKSSEISNKSEKSFLERSIECVKRIIVRKIFAKPNDEIGIILYGCDTTKNDLNSQNLGYENIVEVNSLKMPSWTMLEGLDKLKHGKASVGWTDCLLVALNYISNETEAKKFSHIRIVLFSNFLTTTSDENVDILSDNFTNYEIELIGVSDTIICQESNAEAWQFSQNPQKKNVQRESEAIFEKMVNGLEAANLCHIDYVESQLVYFQKKNTRASPWNVALKIGSKLSVNVSAYVYIQATSTTTSFKTECNEAYTATKMVTEYTKNNEQIQKPNEEDMVKAYFYGSKINACDDETILYESGDKCLLCLSICKRKTCSPKMFAGKGSHVVVAQKDSPKSAALFTSMVKSMHEKDYFMIARKVYRKGSKATIVGLFPQIDENNSCYLVMIELPFREDIKRCHYDKFSTKSSLKPTNEEMTAMENLVKSMDLHDAIDDESGITEAFTIETSLNPFHQYICKTVAHRALYPNTPLPTFHDELRKMIDVPEKIKNNSRDAIKEIERLFPLEIIQHREKKVFGQKSQDLQDDADMNDEMSELTLQHENESNERQIIAVGTVTPAEDFLYLVSKKNERFGVLCEQIQCVIYELIFKSTTEFGDKIQESILAYRDTAKTHGPFNYNTWIKELKSLMIKRNKIDEWNRYIVKEGLGLITINESPVSAVTTEENLEFYEVPFKDVSNTTQISRHDDDDLENLL